MDALGWIYLVVAIVGIAIMDAFLLDLTKRRPRGAALVIALAMVIGGGMIPENNYRELNLLEGMIRVAGWIGIFIGIYGLFRKLPDQVSAAAKRT